MVSPNLFVFGYSIISCLVSPLFYDMTLITTLCWFFFIFVMDWRMFTPVMDALDLLITDLNFDVLFNSCVLCAQLAASFLLIF